MPSMSDLGTRHIDEERAVPPDDWRAERPQEARADRPVLRGACPEDGGGGCPEPGRAGGVPAVTSVHGFQTASVLTVAFAHAVNDTYSSFLAPLLPSFIAKLALSKTQAGLLAFLQSSPSLLQPFVGHLADRISLRYLVILAPALTGTMMSLLGIAPHYAVLALFLTVAGISSAGLHAVGPVTAGRLSGRSLGRGMGLWMVGGTLGFAVGPVIIVWAIGLLSLEGIPWLMILGWLASLVLYSRLRHLPEMAPASGARGSWHEGLLALRPLLVPVVGITVARDLLASSLSTFLPTFLIDEGSSLLFAGVSLSVLQVSGSVGAVLGGWMSDRIGRRLVLLISTIMAPLLMLLFLGAVGWTRLVILLGLGFTGPATRAVVMALVQESCPDNRALANGIYLALAFVTESGSAVVVGLLGDLLGLRSAFTISAAVLLLGLPFISLLPGRKSS
jgi:FSR family fosmidomycin resistance protein-like MFS transporter